jgi:hypothetical protein
VHEADVTAFMCRMSWKSGILNLLETSGPHRACYRTPLPFLLDYRSTVHSPVLRAGDVRRVVKTFRAAMQVNSLLTTDAIYLKLKFTREQAAKTQSGVRGIALLVL